MGKSCQKKEKQVSVYVQDFDLDIFCETNTLNSIGKVCLKNIILKMKELEIEDPLFRGLEFYNKEFYNMETGIKGTEPKIELLEAMRKR